MMLGSRGAYAVPEPAPDRSRPSDSRTVPEIGEFEPHRAVFGKGGPPVQLDWHWEHAHYCDVRGEHLWHAN